MSKGERTPILDWRAHLKTHPAAELFPLMKDKDPAGFEELVSDIRKNGLQSPIVVWRKREGDAFVDCLIDGRNRLDALAMLGWLGPKPERGRRKSQWPLRGPLSINYPDDARLNLPELEIGDAYGFKFHDARDDDDDSIYRAVLSLNVHRRHLTAEQKRELIAKVLKARPETSNRQIAKQVMASHPHVAKVRAELEKSGDVETVTTSFDTKGRKQPAKKASKKIAEPASPFDAAAEAVSSALLGARCGAGRRKQEYAAADKSAVNAKDIALDEFTGHVLRLLQMTKKAKPERFAKTGVNASDLSQLGHFLTEVAVIDDTADAAVGDEAPPKRQQAASVT
jgi:ParB-like nuclease domain